MIKTANLFLNLQLQVIIAFELKFTNGKCDWGLFQLYLSLCYRFVMEEKSPYARPLQKSNAVFKYGADYDDEFEFINNDPSKPAAEHVKDENLSVKQLKMRFPGT